MKRSTPRLAVFMLLAVLVATGDVCATHDLFTSRFPGANDFYPRWRGAQLFWQRGIDPYSEEATLAIQEGIYGRPAQPDEDQVLFAYPFYTVFFMLPLVWLPYSWVHAIWMVFLEFALLAGAFICIDLVGWRLSRWLMGLTALWVLLFYHSARTIFLGQFAAVVFAAAVGVLWCLSKEYDIAAGFLLAVTTLKPQMSVLLIPALLLWGLSRRRWRLLAAFGVSMGVLAGLSFVLVPGWVREFFQQMTLYPSYTAIGSPVWIITRYYFPGLGVAGEVGVSALLLLYALAHWRYLWGVEVNSRRFWWVIGLTLIVTNLIVTRTATTNYVILYIPLIFALKVVVDRQPRGGWLVALFYGLSTVALWWLFLATVVDRFEHPIVYLPLPLGLQLVFVAGRRWLVSADSGPASAVDQQLE